MKQGVDDNSLLMDENAASRGFARWAPMVVVLSVIGGFMALSWYAYHAGMQSVKDEDLLVVEADKTPMKEKPADSGGMQFPNQDKTIFDTFANNPPPVPKVERVLPKPEEPLSKNGDSSETSTWINDKLNKHEQDATDKGQAPKEKNGGSVEKKQETLIYNNKDAKQLADNNAVDHPPHDRQAGDHQVISANPQTDEDQSETFVAHKSAAKPMKALENAINPSVENAQEKTVDEEDKPAAKAVTKEIVTDNISAERAAVEKAKESKAEMVEKPKEDKPEPVKKVKESKKSEDTASNDGAFTVQLGAYRSQQEASDAWDKLHLSQKELSDKEPVIVKADLGERGVYYRLRVGGIASTAEAKTLCKTLSGRGQPCILPKD